jgi:hypothetical protein
MSDELATALQCERNRISTTKNYQFDSRETDQIIMRVDFKEATSGQLTSGELTRNLDEMVKNKDNNLLSTDVNSNSYYLDQKHGAPATEKLWKKYWGFLLAALILLLLLLLLFIFARLRCKDAKNFLPIFIVALIPIDLALDIAFISIHGRDFKWLLPAT